MRASLPMSEWRKAVAITYKIIPHIEGDPDHVAVECRQDARIFQIVKFADSYNMDALNNAHRYIGAHLTHMARDDEQAGQYDLHVLDWTLARERGGGMPARGENDNA